MLQGIAPNTPNKTTANPAERVSRPLHLVVRQVCTYAYKFRTNVAKIVRDTTGALSIH